jgi:hypothetical protein
MVNFNKIVCQDSQSWLKFSPSYEPGKAGQFNTKRRFL